MKHLPFLKAFYYRIQGFSTEDLFMFILIEILTDMCFLAAAQHLQIPGSPTTVWYMILFQ